MVPWNFEQLCLNGYSYTTMHGSFNACRCFVKQLYPGRADIRRIAINMAPLPQDVYI